MKLTQKDGIMCKNWVQSNQNHALYTPQINTLLMHMYIVTHISYPP